MRVASVRAPSTRSAPSRMRPCSEPSSKQVRKCRWDSTSRGRILTRTPSSPCALAGLTEAAAPVAELRGRQRSLDRYFHRPVGENHSAYSPESSKKPLHAAAYDQPSREFCVDVYVVRMLLQRNGVTERFLAVFSEWYAVVL